MTTLRLATANVWGLPAPVSRHPEARIAAIGKRLPALELDVLACQEVWTRSARDTLVDAGRASGLSHVWHREAHFGGSGLLVLSRWPIRDAHFQPFRVCGLPQRLTHLDYYGGKGLVRARLDTPGGELELVDTHLHAGYGHRGFDDEYLGHRVTQMIELASAVATLERPVAVLGDLNSIEDGDELAILLGMTGLRDAAAELDARVDTVRPRARPAPVLDPFAGRIDYVLLRDGRDRSLRARSLELALDEDIEIEGETLGYSDHAAVLAEVEIGGPGSGSPAPAPAARAIERAQALLDHGRDVARTRRREQRGLALVGGVLTAGAGTARARRSRRDWLRTGLGAATVAIAAPTVLLAALAEGFTPGELDGYDAAEALIREIAQLAAERMQTTKPLAPE